MALTLSKNQMSWPITSTCNVHSLDKSATISRFKISRDERGGGERNIKTIGDFKNSIFIREIEVRKAGVCTEKKLDLHHHAAIYHSTKYYMKSSF